MTEPIKIFRGDDTDFIGNKVIEITLDTDIDLSGITADFLLCGFKQHFENIAVETKRLEVIIGHEETKRFPLGRQLGTLVLKSADGKIKHVNTQIEFFVTNKTGFPMFCGDEQIKARFGLKIKWDDIRDTPTTLEGYGITDAVKSVNGKFPDENGNVEVETGGGGTTDYSDLENKPSINGNTLSGNKTAAALGLATAAQGEKADSALQQSAITTNINSGSTGKAADAAAVANKLDDKADAADLGDYIPFANLLGANNKTSIAVGYLASVRYKSQANINAVALGKEAKVRASGGVAIGQYGIAADASSVVVVANIAGDENYPSHGVGTLNLGSRNGMRGIYIQHMHLDSAMAFLLSNIPEIVAPGVVDVYNSFLIEYTPASPSGDGYPVNAYFCHGGRLYRVVSKIDDGIEWEDIPANKYKEVTLREVLFASPAFTGTPTAPTPAAADNSTKIATTAFVKSAIAAVIDEVYPVGAIYVSVSPTSPATLFGVGTWERITGRFLLAATDEGESGAEQAAGRTGGEASHTLTLNEMPSHTHGSKSLTGSWSTEAWNGVAGSGIVSKASSNYNRKSPGSGSMLGRTSFNIDATHEHSPEGGGQAHNNMPPFLSVYMWKRTA